MLAETTSFDALILKIGAGLGLEGPIMNYPSHVAHARAGEQKPRSDHNEI